MSSITDARVFLIMMGARKVGNALYAWGGETETEGGYDCSGFVCHILTETNRAWPGIYTGGRQTAKDIYRYYDQLGCPDINKVGDLAPGCLVFYFNKDKTPRNATHIALHVANVPDMHIAQGQSVFTTGVGPVAFEAGGSGSQATSPRAALQKSATIRVTATDTHGGQAWVAKDPFSHLEKVLNGEVDLNVAAATGGQNVLDKLASETDIGIADLRTAQAKVNPAGATRYNRQQELTGTWKHRDLPAPLPKFPTDSFEFAILVAHLQRALGIAPSKVDGKLGPGTLERMND